MPRWRRPWGLRSSRARRARHVSRWMGAGEFSLQAVPPDLLMLTADLGPLPAELAPAALAAPLESGELVGLSLLREEGGTALLAASLPLSASGPEAVAAVLERLAAAEEAVRNEGLAPFLCRIVPDAPSLAALSTEQGGGAEAAFAPQHPSLTRSPERPASRPVSHASPARRPSRLPPAFPAPQFRPLP